MYVRQGQITETKKKIRADCETKVPSKLRKTGSWTAKENKYFKQLIYPSSPEKIASFSSRKSHSRRNLYILKITKPNCKLYTARSCECKLYTHMQVKMEINPLVLPAVYQMSADQSDMQEISERGLYAFSLVCTIRLHIQFSK